MDENKHWKHTQQCRANDQMEHVKLFVYYKPPCHQSPPIAQLRDCWQCCFAQWMTLVSMLDWAIHLNVISQTLTITIPLTVFNASCYSFTPHNVTMIYAHSKWSNTLRCWRAKHVLLYLSFATAVLLTRTWLTFRFTTMLTTLKWVYRLFLSQAKTAHDY